MNNNNDGGGAGGVDESEQIAQRRTKLAELREQGPAYPNDFVRNNLARELLEQYADVDGETLESEPVQVTVAGRMMSRRVMGKASFAHVQDGSARIQLYVVRDDLPEGLYPAFKRYDIGDIVGAEGTLFRTRTGELSVRVTSLRQLAKCLRPLPEKWHGLSDQETRYRQRYVDLIVTEESREVFVKRAKIIAFVRRFFIEHDYMEVETPMMQVIPGGAVARPFKTHHNALSMDMYLRIAPELYLKRLVVGGFERVFEINRNFRNEGVSTRHNPEFTMLEFYQAYATYEDMIDLTEEMARGIALDLTGGTQIEYQGETIDFGQPSARMSVKDAVLQYNQGLNAQELEDDAAARAFARGLGIAVEPSWGLGKVWMEIFEETVEHLLIQPTFITSYPTEVSPLSRANDDDPFITDRFEYFVGGREIANGFSELNDPEDQAARFRAQVESRDAGDDEAMYYDADYIRALEYGLPPTAGEGVGVDRLVMLFTDQPSIRDVLLFPHMRMEASGPGSASDDPAP